MKAVILGILVAAVIGVGAWFVLNSLDLTTAQAHADDRSVRLD